MSNVLPNRCVQGDWWEKPIPAGVHYGAGFYCETAQSFRHYKATANAALTFGDHVSCYAGCAFAIGKMGTASVGDFTLLNGALIMAEERIEIGSHCLISWNVGIADSDFHPIDPALRRIDAMALAPFYEGKPARPLIGTKPVHIGDNVWIGMGALILKGVSIGSDAVVAAGAVVSKDVPPGAVVAGNPAAIVKRLY